MKENNTVTRLVHQMAQNKLNLYLELNDNANKHEIALIGDSLIENFPINELYHGEKIIYNRGIAGSSTYDILSRLDSLILPLQPDKAFLLAGTNDFLPHIVDNDEISIANRIIKICDNLKEYNHSCKIYVLSLFPVNTSNDRKIYNDWIIGKNNLKIESVNSRVQALCDKKEYSFINVYPYLIDKTGQLKIKFTLDGTHVNIHAYKLILEYIKEFF